MQHLLDQILCPTAVTVAVRKALPEFGQLVKQLPEGIIGSNLEVSIFISTLSLILASMDPVNVFLWASNFCLVHSREKASMVTIYLVLLLSFKHLTFRKTI